MSSVECISLPDAVGNESGVYLNTDFSTAEQENIFGPVWWYCKSSYRKGRSHEFEVSNFRLALAFDMPLHSNTM